MTTTTETKTPNFDALVRSIREDGELPSFNNGIRTDVEFSFPLQSCGSSLPATLTINSKYHASITEEIDMDERIECIETLLLFMAKRRRTAAAAALRKIAFCDVR